MSVHVTGCRILVKPLTLEEIDPTAARMKALGMQFGEKNERAIMVAAEKGILLQVGPKASDEYLEGAKVGDIVGFTKYGGKVIKDQDEDLIIINDEDCLCVFRND